MHRPRTPAVAAMLLFAALAHGEDWTRALATRSHDLAFGLAADARGRLYAGTIFQARFDAAAHGGSGRHAPQGANDSWVFALAPDGSPRWARPIAGEGRTELRDLALTAEGRVVAAGYFLGEAVLGGARRARALAGADAFVAAFDADGAPLWLARHGGKGADAALALAPHARGVVVAGSFEHAIGLGEEAPGRARVLRSAGRRDAWIARLDRDGRVVAAEAHGGSGDDRAIAVAAAPDGGYAVLVLRGAAPGASSGTDDALVLRYDVGGALVARATIAQDGADGYDAIAIASDGAVWIGGRSSAAGALEAGGERHRLEHAGSSDAVLVVFDPALAKARVVRFGNEGADTIERLAPADDGAMYVAGGGVGSIALGRRRHEAPGPRAWVARVEPDGRIAGSTLHAAEGITQATGLVALRDGRVALLGLFEKTLDADPPLRVLGKTDAFVAVREAPR